MASLFHHRTFTNEVALFTIGTANTNVAMARWRLHSGAGTATSLFFVAIERVGDPVLADLNPATNSRWAPTPFAFSAEPNDGSGATSGAAPFADVSGKTLLWQLTVVGTVELSGDADTRGANL